MSGRAVAMPASSGQQRLWFYDQLVPGTPMYNVHLGTELRGRLAVPALAAALNDVIARHEALRTTLRAVDGVPRQLVTDDLTVPTAVHDLTGLAGDRRSAEIDRRAAAHAATVFALAAGPLLRSDVLRLADDHHIWLLTLHHVVCDGQSAGLLFTEISAAYRARLAERPHSLRDLQLQYADYAVWQQETLGSGGFDDGVAYWREQLAGVPALLPLPTDRPRPRTASFSGALVGADLSGDEVAAVDAVAGAHRATRFQVVLAALAAALHRLSGEQDIVVGTAMDGRNHAELEPLIGFFVNTVPLRLRVAPGMVVGELVDHVRDVALDAQSHGDVPFELLVRELRPGRETSHHPLFQVMLDVQPGRADALRLPGVSSRTWPTVDRATALFDLGVSLIDGAHGIGLVAEHATDLFTSATAAELLDACRAVVCAAHRDPGRPVAELPLLDRAHARRTVAAADRRDEAEDAEDVVTAVHRVARRAPSATAVVDGATGATVDYRTLVAWSTGVTAGLRAAGVSRGDHVVLLADRSAAAIAGQLGVLGAGAGYVPVDPAAPATRRRELLDATRPAAVLVGPGVPPPIGPWVVVELDGDPRGSTTTTDGDSADRVGVTGNDAAYVLHTSGSTGTPKGVIVTHGGLANYAAADRAAYRLTPADRVLQFTALTFDVSAEEIWPCLTAGAALVLRTDAMLDTPHDFLDGCGQAGVSVVHLPTSWFHELVTDVQRGDARVPTCLRMVVIGGEPALPARIEAWRAVAPDVGLCNVYGPTEATIATTLAWLGGPATDGPCWRVPIGRSLAGTAVHVLDAALQPVPPGVIGELHIGGVGLARGYLDRPDLTAERFVPDPQRRGARLYRTGDLGRRLHDGALVFCGRTDRQVKVRGHRIEPGEVEDRIAALPGVRHALVQARPVNGPDPQLIAFVEVDTGVGTDVADLRWMLADLLPAHLLPSYWVPVERMPRSAAGKLDPSALPDPASVEPTASGVTGGDPRNEMEARVSQVWREVLGVARIGREDDFFAAGGHSLLATRVVARLRRRYGVRVGLHHVFSHPRLADFAAAVSTPDAVEADTSVPTLRAVTAAEMRASVAVSVADPGPAARRHDVD